MGVLDDRLLLQKETEFLLEQFVFCLFYGVQNGL